MSKKEAQENIKHILKQLLEHKDCVTMSGSVHSNGSLYDDVVEDIENYLNILEEPS